MDDEKALAILVDHDRAQHQADSERRTKMLEAQQRIDEARLAISQLAAPAVKILACRLMGVDVDSEGRKITESRELTALEVLDRCGIPKLRAHAVAASIAQSAMDPVAGHPGWVEPEVGRGDENGGELDPASVDAQIAAFLAGARAQRDVA